MNIYTFPNRLVVFSNIHYTSTFLVMWIKNSSAILNGTTTSKKHLTATREKYTRLHIENYVHTQSSCYMNACIHLYTRLLDKIQYTSSFFFFLPFLSFRPQINENNVLHWRRGVRRKKKRSVSVIQQKYVCNSGFFFALYDENSVFFFVLGGLSGVILVKHAYPYMYNVYR